MSQADGKRTIVRAFAIIALLCGVLGASSTNAQRRSSSAVAAPHMTVHYIDVDQGAAALLEFPCGAVLIDAGGRGTNATTHLITYLRTFFANRPALRNRLAAVFITHAHIDHDRNLRRVAETFAVGGFIYNGKIDQRTQWMLDRGRAPATRFPIQQVTDAELADQGHRGLTNGVIDPVACPGVDPDIRVLSGGQSTNPGWGGEFTNPNNHSLVIRVDYGDSSFLFTGDLEAPAIGTLLQGYAGTDMLNVDVFEVGHHGAENGTTREFMRAMTPEIAIISAGQPGTVKIPMSAFDYGHPRTATFTLLESFITRSRVPPVNIMTYDGEEVPPRAHAEPKAIYSTSRDGDISVLAPSHGRIEVATSRP